MSKSYKEIKKRDKDYDENIKPRYALRPKSKKEKFISNALRSKNLIDLIKYSEEE